MLGLGRFASPEHDAANRRFVPGVQAEQTLDRSHGGLGLGLALVKRLEELHGGTVSARSEGLGCGMEVSLRLALDTRIPPESEIDRSSQETAAQHCILLIEDNADAAELLRDALQLRGHQVAIAYDGWSKCSLLPAVPPPATSGGSAILALRVAGGCPLG